ncbi:Indoleamine 2,3-dioxygenase [Schizopora paradoxa]|uniref:Indoleamine 2,3-dioxygenase n=1 Tax=Schizopora paradoxa TaxID=27342 RepID=A0A0H2SE11_9AGAM|nr:Indoleamine 2,3-dioxygenase [Schizopora paradoxa]
MFSTPGPSSVDSTSWSETPPLHNNDAGPSNLPPTHFLSQPRPEAEAGPPEGVVDTTTLAAHDFDVDPRTGFMPPQPPLARLPCEWEAWEVALDDAISQKLCLGSTPDLDEASRNLSERWREGVRKISILPTSELKASEVMLRRAHLVLAWLMHFYINTLPPASSIVIPKPISIPLLQVSSWLALPPLLTYSDDVLYNWRYLKPPHPLSTGPFPTPAPDNLACVTTFTSTPSESHFYLTSARIELHGVRALALMKATMDEAFVRDALALRRIAAYLHALARLVGGVLTDELLRMREGCAPDVFYHQIRPWFKGEDSMPGARRWVFEGVGDEAVVRAHGECMRAPPKDLSGPSAGQSALVHALNIFLGVNVYAAHARGKSGEGGDGSVSGSGEGVSAGGGGEMSAGDLMIRMQRYMPRHHRAFLRHLSANPRPLRALVQEESSNMDLVEAYNAAVTALKTFRDAHIRIVTLYIVGPSRRVDAGRKVDAAAAAVGKGHASLSKGKIISTEEDQEKGTGGTKFITFLKNVRDVTANSVVSQG